MNRRTHIRRLGGLGLAAGAAGWTVPPTAADFADEMARYARHWEVAAEYLLAVFDAMPPEFSGFRPSEDQMTFAEQFAHVAYWSTFLVGTVVEEPAIEQPETVDPAVVRTYVADAYAHCRGLLDGMTAEALARDIQPTPRWPVHTGWEMLGRAYMHTAHHRGQAVVYLRMKGVTPPWFQY